jgi:integrase
LIGELTVKELPTPDEGTVKASKGAKRAKAVKRMRGVTLRLCRGHWWVFVNHNGQRKAKAFATKEKADKFARKVEAALKSATWNLALLDWKLPGAAEPEPTAQLTFAQYVEAYLKAKEPNDAGQGPLKFSTWCDYSSVVRMHLNPVLGEEALASINRDDVRALPAALRGMKRSPHVIHKTVRILSAILSEAAEAKLIAANPALGIKWKGELRAPRRPIIPPTADELRKVLATARDYHIQRGGKIVYPYRGHYVFILLSAHTGLRLGEALALKLGDVDWNGKLLHVQRAWVRGRLTTPKSHQVRVVDLNDTVFGVLKALRDERFPDTVVAIDSEERARLEAQRAQEMFDAWIFPNAEGRPIDAQKWRRRVWYPLLVKAGVRHVRIHDLRHGFASMLLDEGESPYYVQQMLGHHDAAFTMRVYGHHVRKAQRGVDKLATLVPVVAERLQNCDPSGPPESTSVHKTPNKCVAVGA